MLYELVLNERTPSYQTLLCKFNQKTMTESNNVTKTVTTKMGDANDVDIDEIDEDLLDSAFEDIAQNKISKNIVDTRKASITSTVDKEKSPANTAPSQNSTASSSAPKDENIWSDEYFKQMTQDLEKNMESFVSGDSSQLDSLLEEMMNNVNLNELNTPLSNGTSSTQTEQSLEEKLKESVEELTRGIKNLPMNNLGNLMRGDSEDTTDAADPSAAGNMMPFLEDIMQQFLSKEVLYPVFSETVAKYPEWLESNKAKLSAEQYDNYSKQNDIMSRVVAEFDSEAPSDGAHEKKARFNRILELLQRMQEYGAPPKDLVGEESFPTGGDLAAMGGPGGLGAACSIM